MLTFEKKGYADWLPFNEPRFKVIFYIYILLPGKDRIIFATKEDHDERSKAAYLLEEDDDDDEPGMTRPIGNVFKCNK